LNDEKGSEVDRTAWDGGRKKATLENLSFLADSVYVEEKKRWN
jgi:hypothetical protein